MWLQNDPSGVLALSLMVCVGGSWVDSSVGALRVRSMHACVHEWLWVACY